MDVTLLSPGSIKVKGKVASFIVEPRDTKGKLAADAVITFDSTPIDISAIDGARVTLAGPGDYEVGGVKLVGVKGPSSSMYYINLDNMSVMVGKVSAFKGKDTLRDADVAIFFADELVDASLLATLDPRVTAFYGEKAEENIKALGKESTPVSKYTITRDKLPAEMEAVLLA